MLLQRLTEKADRKLTSINLKHTVSFPSAQQAKRKKKEVVIHLITIGKQTVNCYCKLKSVIS